MISSSYLRRLFFCFISLLPLIGFSAVSRYQYFCLRYVSNGLLYSVRVIPYNFSPGAQWVTSTWSELESAGAPNYYYRIKGSQPVVYLQGGSIGSPFDADDSSVNNANTVFGSINDPLDFNLYDYNSGLDSGIPRMKDAGTPILDNTGKPVGVVGYNSDGEKTFLPTVDYNGGYAAVGYDSSGNQGVYYISSGTDGMYPQASFTPSGSSDSGSSSINTNSPPPLSDNIPPVQTDSDGKVSVPTQTVPVSDGSGGSVNITMRDYSPLLSQIAQNQIEGINRVDQNFSQLNSNLETIFKVDSVPDVAPNTDPTFDTSSVDSEAQEQLEQVSGWDFSFGLGANPIGNIFTSLIGNPPTSFGRVDQVWDVDFTIFGDVTVHSSFKLSDYFIPAFRSLFLFILSILFAIAFAHQISKAWS